MFESPKNEQSARKRISRMLLTSRELTRIMKTFMSFVITSYPFFQNRCLSAIRKPIARKPPGGMMKINAGGSPPRG